MINIGMINMIETHSKIFELRQYKSKLEISTWQNLFLYTGSSIVVQITTHVLTGFDFEIPALNIIQKIGFLLLILAGFTWNSFNKTVPITTIKPRIRDFSEHETITALKNEAKQLEKWIERANQRIDLTTHLGILGVFLVILSCITGLLLSFFAD